MAVVCVAAITGGTASTANAAKPGPTPYTLCGPGCDGGGTPPPYTCNYWNEWTYAYWPAPPYLWQCRSYGQPIQGYAWVMV